MKKILKYCVASSIFFTGLSVNASPLIFTDKAAWQAAAGGGIGDLFEDFNSFSSDAFYGDTPVNAGFLTLSVVNGASDASWLVDAGVNNFSSIPGVNGTTFATTLVAVGYGGTRLSFAPVAAFGFEYAGSTYSATNGTLMTSLGDAVVLAPTSLGTQSFVGILYTAGETMSSLTWAPGRFAAGIDNVEAFSSVASTVPEPTTLLLSVLGVAGVALRKKKIN